LGLRHDLEQKHHGNADEQDRGSFGSTNFQDRREGRHRDRRKLRGRRRRERYDTSKLRRHARDRPHREQRSSPDQRRASLHGRGPGEERMGETNGQRRQLADRRRDQIRQDAEERERWRHHREEGRTSRHRREGRRDRPQQLLQRFGPPHEQARKRTIEPEKASRRRRGQDKRGITRDERIDHREEQQRDAKRSHARRFEGERAHEHRDGEHAGCAKSRAAPSREIGVEP